MIKQQSVKKKPISMTEKLKSLVASKFQKSKWNELDEIPNSILHTKMELPILYSNLITIEDMKIENSNYFVRSNGFITSSLKLSSMYHDRHFSTSDCVFRILPKTYNINKYKVIQYINEENPGEIDENELNFKFESEMDNNLDIVQGKFGEKVRYGDIIILMHENSQKFVKFDHMGKKLVLSNHDSEYSLFQVEPFCDIMLNDDQVLKSGQPLKLKIASFDYADKNLYLNLYHPYQTNQELPNKSGAHFKKFVKHTMNFKEKLNFELLANPNEINYNSGYNDNLENNFEEDQAHGELGENINNNYNLNVEDKEIYNKKYKCYLIDPELTVEEELAGRWRFNLYSTFTLNENLLVYGDFVNIFHCNSNSNLTLKNIKISAMKKANDEDNENSDLSPFRSPVTSFDQNNEALLNETNLSGNRDDSYPRSKGKDLDVTENVFETEYNVTSEFCLNKLDTKNDVNGVWILENIFPNVKNLCFVRFFDETKADTYRMKFRIKNFKTGKYLSIKKKTEGNTNFDSASSVNYLNNEKNENYNFFLIDSAPKLSAREDITHHILSQEYQYSLFALLPSHKSATNNNQESSSNFSNYKAAEKNQFLRLFHVATKSYLKIKLMPSEGENSDEEGDLLSLDGLSKLSNCHLTLIKNEEEQEVFKIMQIGTETVWTYKFLNNMFYILKSVFHRINEGMSAGMNFFNENSKKEKDVLFLDDKSSQDSAAEILLDKINIEDIKTIKKVLRHLYEFLINNFIHKFSHEHQNNSVVTERQKMIFKYGFITLLLKDFIYNFWIGFNNKSNLYSLINLIKRLKKVKGDNFINFNNYEKFISKIWKYTDLTFQFILLCCRDNPEIKTEIYENLDVLFYFLNLKESCVNLTIEVFKNNPKILHSLIKDCKSKDNFKSALKDIHKNFFYEQSRDKVIKQYRKFTVTPKLSRNANIKETEKENNLFDLIVMYIKISKYEKQNEFAKSENLSSKKENKGPKYPTISIVTKDKLYELLKSMVITEEGYNILENQREIVDKFIKSNSLRDEQNEMQACLIDLVVSVSIKNPDPNVNDFHVLYLQMLNILTSIVVKSKNSNLNELNSQNNFFNFSGNDMNFISNANSTSNSSINKYYLETMTVFQKLVSFLVLSKFYENSNFSNLPKISLSQNLIKFFQKRIHNIEEKFFHVSKNSLTQGFLLGNTQHKENLKSKLNFNNKEEIKEFTSTIEFIKTVYKNNLNLCKDQLEIKFLPKLIFFITESYLKNEKIKLYIMQEEMRKKQISLNSRITEFDRSNYLTLAKSWINVYNVFRNKINSQIEEEVKVIKRKSAKFGGFFETGRERKNSNYFESSKKIREEVDLENPNPNLNDNENEKSQLISKGKHKNSIGKIFTPAAVSPNFNSNNNNFEENLYEDEIKISNQNTNNKDNVVSLFGESKNHPPTGKKFDFYTMGELHENQKNFKFQPFNSNYNKQMQFESLRDDRNLVSYKLHSMEIKRTLIESKVFTSNKHKNENFLEDERRKNRKIVITSILSLFQTLIDKNTQLMCENFYKNFSFNINSEKNKDLCMFIPKIEAPQIKFYIDNYMKEEKNHSQTLFQNKKDLFNFNLVFKNERDPNLNFVHNLIIAFNTQDELDIQEDILYTIYKLFGQRQRFVKKLIKYREKNTHLGKFINSKKEDEKFSEKFDFKLSLQNRVVKIFSQFGRAYNKIKQETNENNFAEISDFINLIYLKHKELVIGFFNIIRDFCEGSNDNILRNEIEEIISELENSSNPLNTEINIFDESFSNNSDSENSDASKGSVIRNKLQINIFKIFIHILNFIRKNKNKISCIISNLKNENFQEKEIFLTMSDLITKGKKFFYHFNCISEKNKLNKSHRFSDLKIKFFSSFLQLISILNFTMIRNQKNSLKFEELIIRNENIFQNNSEVFLILLFLLSDLQKEKLKMDSLFIMKNLKFLSNLKNISEQNMSKEFLFLYLDIMLNVLDFINDKGEIPIEENLDEIIIENFFFISNKISSFSSENLFDTKKEEIFKFLKLITHIFKIENLNTIFKLKLRENFSEILNIIPEPIKLIEIFKFYVIKTEEDYENFEEKEFFDYINFASVKNSKIQNEINFMSAFTKYFTIFKYFMLYMIHVNNEYLKNPERDENLLNYKNLIRFVFSNHFKTFEQDKSNTKKNSFFSPPKNILSNKNFHDFNQFLNFFGNSNFIIILSCYANKLLKNDTQHKLKIKTNSSFENFEGFSKDLSSKYLKQKNSLPKKFYIRASYIYKKLDKFLKLEKPDCKILTTSLEEISQIRKNILLPYNIFKKTDKERLRELISCEEKSFIFYLLSLLEIKHKTKKYEDILSSFLYKIIDFIYKSSMHIQTGKIKKINNFFLICLKEFIQFFDGKQNQLPFLKKGNLLEIQNLFERTEISLKFFDLICNYTTPSIQDHIPYIFDILNMLLLQGNINWQEIMYQNFNQDYHNEKVFKYVDIVIKNKISDILNTEQNKKGIGKFKKYKKIYDFKMSFFNRNFSKNLDGRILNFLQLLCENQNSKMQIYLHHQENFQKSYNLVSLTQVYLQALYNNFNINEFESLMRCFDLLIRLTQGPCMENQMTLINSKLLITISEIFNTYIQADSSHNFIMEISLLAYKSSKLLLALIEARTKTDKIYEQITLNLKLDIVEKMFFKIYNEHEKMFFELKEEGSINIRDLNRAEQIEDLIKNKKVGNQKHIITETGYNLYFFYLYIKDYKEKNQMRSNKPVILLKKYLLDKRNILYIFFLFIKEEFISLLRFFNFIITWFLYLITCGKVNCYYNFLIFLRKFSFNNSNAWQFYEKDTKSIEILRDDIVYKIYFLSYPFLRNLNKFQKTSFIENLDRSNSKTKLMDILKYSNKLKYELEYDYKVKKFLGKIPIIGIVFKHIELWKHLSLLLNLIQNFFNIVGYYKEESFSQLCLDAENCVTISQWFDHKVYFNITEVQFSNLVNLLAVIQISLVSTIVIEFFCRKTPTIIQQIHEELSERIYSPILRKIVFIKEFLHRIIFSFEVIYNLCYVTAAILGYISSDFFFAFLLLEVVMRIKTLRNVLMAIRNPFKELVLTMLLWIILVYYASILVYAFFQSYLLYPGSCQSLVICLATVFYNANKWDNGITGYLRFVPIDENSKNPLNARFWFDQIFNLIVKILIVEIVAGIIIDNFAKLRSIEGVMVYDMSNICTICGLKKDEIEKLSPNGWSFENHINVDHNIFNYVHYIISLFKKDTGKYTGMESYIGEMVFEQKDITWFPIGKLYYTKNEFIEGKMIVEDNEEKK